MSEHVLTGYALVILHKDDRIALLKRADNARFAPGLYSLIGGRVEKGENFRQTLVREVYEEVGITISLEDLHFMHTFYRQGATEELVALVFECFVWQGEPFNKEPEKHKELVWYSINNLPENLIPAHYGALELIRQKSLYSEQQAG